MSIFNSAKRNDIINRIRSLSPESQALWGKMNVNQMLCHTTDQMRGCLGDLDGKFDSSTFLSRKLLKWLVLYVMPIPKNVPTSPRADQMKDGTKPINFESDRQTLLDYVEKTNSLSDDFAWSSHFKFGELTRREWGILIDTHLNHHLKQFGV